MYPTKTKWNLMIGPRKPLGNLQETSRKPRGRPPGKPPGSTTRKPKPSGNLQETFRKPQENLQEIHVSDKDEKKLYDWTRGSSGRTSRIPAHPTKAARNLMIGPRKPLGSTFKKPPHPTKTNINLIDRRDPANLPSGTADLQETSASDKDEKTLMI